MSCGSYEPVLLVVLQNIDAIVKNSAYVESGKVTAKSGGKRQTVQHDYFEVPVTIAGEKYIARFDVAVKKAQNVVDGIEIEKAPETGNSPYIIPSSTRNRSADDVSRAYIYLMRQTQSSETTENNAHKLDIGTRVGYDGSVKLVTTEGAGENLKSKLIPPTEEIRGKFYNEGLTQDKIDQIVSLPKSQKPKPDTYLSSKYIEAHKQSFKDSGLVKIMPTEPTGTIGGKGGTFVMSGDQLNDIINSSKGDISKIEDALGFDRGYLGKNPVLLKYVIIQV